MLRPTKHSHPDRTVVNVALLLLTHLRKRRLDGCSALRGYAKKVVVGGDVLFLPALNFLFLLGLIEYLVTHRNDSDVHALLTSYVFYLQPLVNPDGHEAKTRADSEGVDLNRDYAFPGSKSGESFKRKETQLMKNLVDQIKPRAAAAYHSGIEEVLWPWCFTADPVANEKLFYAVTEKTAKSMKMDRYLQSYDDYATEGEFIDYAYMAHSTLALTFEVSEIKTPPAKDLEAVVSRSVKGALTFAQAVWDADHGMLALTSLPTDFHSKARPEKTKLWPFGRLE